MQQKKTEHCWATVIEKSDMVSPFLFNINPEFSVRLVFFWLQSVFCLKSACNLVIIFEKNKLLCQGFVLIFFLLPF